MMRYVIYGAGFPVGQWLIAPGTLIDDDPVSGELDQWSAIIKERGIIPPMNAQALDKATYDFMVRTYGEHRVGLYPIPGTEPKEGP